MLINEMPLKAEPSYDFSLLAPKERIIFFDIETTGLSAASSQLYLIGAVFYNEGQWLLRQYFAERPEDEPRLLEGFFSLLDERRRLGRVILLSFNGDGFDIPYINYCLRARHQLMYHFQGTYSVDLFKRIKPYKKLIGLENCKLKTVEKLCGIYREDKYNGGELIYVYEEYLRLSSLDPDSCEYTDNNMKLKDALLKTLLLHNAEDIMDMPMIMDILGYDSLFGGEFTVTESKITDGVWDIRAKLSIPLPRGIYYEDEYLTASISEEDRLGLNIAVNVYEGELKSFYADYKSYYYLPEEDCAVHKSLGEFVDRKKRRQATAKNCYQRISGQFIPEPEAVFAPVFYREYRQQGFGQIDIKNEAFSLCEDAAVSVDFDRTKRYIKAVLNSMLQGAGARA